MSCSLDRGPELLRSWPLSPDAKLSKEAGPYNPANVAIQQGEMPWVQYRLRPAFSRRSSPDGPQTDTATMQKEMASPASSFA
jgi:hypothetical protein